MRLSWFIVGFFILTVSFSHVVLADKLTAVAELRDDPTENGPSFSLDPIVIIAARVEQRASQVGSSVTVLHADELMERGVEFVADALTQVPSLNVASQGPRGSFTQIRVRGNEASHVLILIDGMRVSDVTTGEYDLANLMLHSVDRIEVLLGPQSTLYGSDAIAGVINIVTRKGGKRDGGKLQYSTGTLNTHSGFAQVFGGKQGWHYAATLSHYQTDGISAAAEKNGNTEQDGYEYNSFNAKAGFDHKAYQTWVTILKNRSQFEFDGADSVTGLAIDNVDNNQWIDTQAASWVLALPLFNEQWNNQLQLTSAEYDYESYVNDPMFGASRYITESDRDSIDYQGDFRITPDHILQFGANYIKGAIFVDGFSRFEKDDTQRGVYLQWLAKLDSFDLSVGGRGDNHKEYGQHNTYRVTANYRWSTQWRVRSAYGTGFKTPNPQELYDPGYGGNPDLQPEESRSFEVGIEHKHSSYLASLTLFDQETRNLIRPIAGFGSLLVNVDNAQSRGVEMSMKTQWDKVKIDSVITWLDATETKDGVEKERIRVPEWSGKLVANYEMPGGRLWTEARYVGDRRDTKYANFTAEDVTLGAYWVFNIGTSLDIAKNVALSMRFENLLDRDYEEIYSYGTRGRSAFVSVDWAW